MIDGRFFRFDTPAQQALCRRAPLAAETALRHDKGRQVAATDGVPHALAALGKGAFAWVGADGALRRDVDCAGAGLGRVRRLVESCGTLWALGEGGLAAIDGSMLQVIERISQPGALDIAGDGKGGVWVLGEGELGHLNSRGRERRHYDIDPGYVLIACNGDVVALLDPQAGGLALLRQSRSNLTIGLQKLGPADARPFRAIGLSASGTDGPFLLTGDWTDGPGFLALDSGGSCTAIGRWDGGDAPPLAIPDGSDVLAMFASGNTAEIVRFTDALLAGGEVLLTPALECDTLSASWQRADLAAMLPAGATLSLRWAASADPALLNAARSILADQQLADHARIAQLLALLPWAPDSVTYVGEREAPDFVEERFSLPLGDVPETTVWIAATVHRNGAPQAPSLGGLRVLHDSDSLMEHLPAIYRTPEGDADGTLARLVTVLEATSFGFDEQIDALADMLDPGRCADRWLPVLAARLGLPFDAALDPAQQRRVVQAAPKILEARGTRAGIVALLGALFGDRPFRVVDWTERSIPVTLGGRHFQGSRLPAFVSGPSARVPMLNARLVLGATALCPLEEGGKPTVSRAPEVHVSIPASDRERRRLEGPVRQMIEQIIPAGVRLELRWIGFDRAAAGAVLDILGSGPRLTVGGVSGLGSARLGGEHHTGLGSDGHGLGGRLE